MRIVERLQDKHKPPYLTVTIQTHPGEEALYEEVLLTLDRNLVRDSERRGSRLRFTLVDVKEVKRRLSGDGKNPLLVELGNLL